MFAVQTQDGGLLGGRHVESGAAEGADARRGAVVGHEDLVVVVTAEVAGGVNVLAAVDGDRARALDIDAGDERVRAAQAVEGDDVLGALGVVDLHFGREPADQGAARLGRAGRQAVRAARARDDDVVLGAVTVAVERALVDRDQIEWRPRHVTDRDGVGAAERAHVDALERAEVHVDACDVAVQVHTGAVR